MGALKTFGAAIVLDRVSALRSRMKAEHSFCQAFLTFLGVTFSERRRRLGGGDAKGCSKRIRRTEARSGANDYKKKSMSYTSIQR